VPISATYAAKNLLDITVVSLTDTAATAIPAVVDDGLHVVSYRGDLNGDRNIGPGDATLALRLQSGVLSTTGFTAFQQVDPYLASDMNDDGTATPGDITGLLRFQSGAAGGFNRIPALPVGLTPPITYAADPQIFIPTELSAQPSEVVSVPIRINVTDPQGIDLAGVAVTFAYDPLQFSVSNVRLGDTLAAKGFAASFNTAVPGLVQLITATDVGPALATGYIGDLFVFDLTVNANATAGSFSLNLLSVTNATDNNSNNLLLAPAIQDDWDVNDGVITVMATAKAIRSDINGDGTVDIDDIVAAIFYLNNSSGVDLSLATAAVIRANVVLDSQLDIRDILTVIYDYNAKDQGTGEAAASSDPYHDDVVPDEELIDVLDLIAADLVLNRKKRG
jgi:hypothetical protein